MIKRKENPAKAFLRRYIGLCGQVDALNRAIFQAMERAMNTGVTIKEVKVLSSPAEHDPMARDVASAVDACEILYQKKAEAEAALREILAAIDSLSDERQKELLTRRYVSGEGFPEIMTAMHYEKTQVFVIHGRALMQVNKWIERRAYNGNRLENRLYENH